MAEPPPSRIMLSRFAKLCHLPKTKLVESAIIRLSRLGRLIPRAYDKSQPFFI
jgi:hypothetical protein